MARHRFDSAETILKELGEAAENAAKTALAEGVEIVMKEAKERCPVYDGMDNRVVKGALRDSIHAEKERGGKEYRIVADAQAKDGLYYGKIVEFSPKINRPFLYPALDAKRETVKKKIVDAVREAIRKK
ncbi:MAG: HK97 gp10 family phage protein [Selenomonadaceae bacterium]|nr:HK97 gp10 family phage protein [Selenomonadaceae bacterium]